jgi:predicted DNA-binding protein (UPF0278 family)
MLDIDEIRKEIALKYDTVLRKDDPILSAVIINEIVLAQYVDAMNERHAQYLKTVEKLVEASIQKGISEAKLTAGRVITESSVYASDQIRAAVSEVMRESREEFKQEMRKAWVAIQAAKRTAIMGAAVSATCSVIMVGAMATMATHVL